MLNFSNEEEARQQAQNKVLEFLNSRQYQNPERFDELHLHYKGVVEQLEAKVAFNIKSQIENVNTTRGLIQDCQNNIESAECQLQKMNVLFDEKECTEMESFERLSICRKNVGLMLDQLKYLFNVKAQIEKMEVMFEQGEDNFESIHYKLKTLTEIRDNVVKSISGQQEMQVIVQEFSSLSAFETRYYDTVFKSFQLTLLLSLKKPALLVTLLRITESAKKKDRAIMEIRFGIDKKFEDKLKDCKDQAVLVLENSRFAANDLVLVLDHTVKCFPAHYEIFDVFESQYRANIEKRVLPFLEDEEQVKESYGTLIVLLDWVDTYGNLMQRVGLNADSYEMLKARVKSYMPYFLEHVGSLMRDYGEKALLKDKEEQQTQKNLERLIKQRQELVTYYPEDIFHFLNQQVEILGPKLKGELYIEFVRTIVATLEELQSKEATNFLAQVPLSEEQGALSPIFLVILQINNFYKCMTYANESRQQCLRFAESSERIEMAFNQELKFNKSINLCLDHMVKMVFYEVNSQLIPELFTGKWVNEDIVGPIITTIKDYLDDVHVLLVNPIHFNKLCKLSFQNLVIAYVEQLILSIRFIQPTMAKNFFPSRLTDLKLMQPQDKDKKTKEKKVGMTRILQSKELTVGQIKADKERLMDTCWNVYGDQLGAPGQDWIEKRLDMLINLLTRSKMELEGMLTQLVQLFEDKSAYLLEVILWMREDIDSQFKAQRMDQIQSMISAKK